MESVRVFDSTRWIDGNNHNGEWRKPSKSCRIREGIRWSRLRWFRMEICIDTAQWCSYLSCERLGSSRLMLFEYLPMFLNVQYIFCFLRIIPNQVAVFPPFTLSFLNATEEDEEGTKWIFNGYPDPRSSLFTTNFPSLFPFSSTEFPPSVSDSDGGYK